MLLHHRRLFHFVVLCLLAGLTPALLTGCATIRDRRVLIMDFENTVASGNGTANYGVSLAEMMTACLANSARIAVLDRQALGSLMARTTGARALRWQEVGRKAQADYVIVGSIARLDQNYIINARLLSVKTGEIVKGSSVTRYAKREEDIYPSVQAICHVLSYQLKYLAELYDARAKGVKVSHTAAAPAAQEPGVTVISAPDKSSASAPSVPQGALPGAPAVQITQ